MAFLSTAEDYESLGLTPPEHTEHGTVQERELLRYQDDHIHAWTQFGGVIHCEKGTHPHGRAAKMDQILIGTDEQGEPIYKNLDFIL